MIMESKKCKKNVKISLQTRLDIFKFFIPKVMFFINKKSLELDFYLQNKG